MIYGVGHDILEIKRIEQILSGRNREAFLHRILTLKEYEMARNRGRKIAEFTAGRFTAKEAIVKAFGCGIGAIINFGDIEVLPDDMGKPKVELSEQAWGKLDLSAQAKGYAIHLSITHQKELASAFAVIERLT